MNKLFNLVICYCGFFRGINGENVLTIQDISSASVAPWVLEAKLHASGENLYHTGKFSSESLTPADYNFTGSVNVSVNVSGYKDLFKSGTIIVDKSLFIKDFLLDFSAAVSITCPRRWGKTMNLSMLKNFLEIIVDEAGNRIQRNTTSNYKLFCKGKIDFISQNEVTYKLKISEHQDIIEKYLGKYPVITISFAGVKSKTYWQTVVDIENSLSNTFREHKYLMKALTNLEKSDQLSYVEKLSLQNDINTFRKIMDNTYRDEKEYKYISIGLRFLSRLLKEWFGQKVIILIDECDTPTPITNIIENQESSDFENTMSLLKLIMFNALKENPHLEKALVTGIIAISHNSLFSGLNNLVHYHFLSKRYGKYYGITETEMQDLINKHGIQPNLANVCKKWYKGYWVSGENVYNIYSIMLFLGHKKINNYWALTSNTDFLLPLMNIDIIKHALLDLIFNKSVNIKVKNLEFTLHDFQILKNLLQSDYDNINIDQDTRDIFLSYLFSAGYFTTDEEPGWETNIRIPNTEILSEFLQYIDTYPKEIFTVDHKLYNAVVWEIMQFTNNYKRNDVTNLLRSFQNYVYKLPDLINMPHEVHSMHMGIHGNENLIHSLFSAIVKDAKAIGQIGFEVEYRYEHKGSKLKKQRPDIIILTENGKVITLFEFKYQRSADFALKECVTRYRSLVNNYYKEAIRVRYIGINVSYKKKVSVSMKVETRSPQANGPIHPNRQPNIINNFNRVRQRTSVPHVGKQVCHMLATIKGLLATIKDYYCIEDGLP